MDSIIKLYKSLGKLIKIDARSNEVTMLLLQICRECFDFLSNLERVPLTSDVPGKNYFAFGKLNKLSRPVNPLLFTEDMSLIEKVILCISEDRLIELSPNQITACCYTIAISFCCVIDINKNGDKKTPGTFFEFFICHLFSIKLGINPRKQVEVLNLDMNTTLPTDNIFDLGINKPKIHLPIKTSTRERVIQVWAHQRVLDGVYGTGRFLGTLVCLSETKLDIDKRKVIEICLPDQWRVYQLFISQMKRIYYLDVPDKYSVLNETFPRIHVKPFGEFFYEFEDLLVE